MAYSIENRFIPLASWRSILKTQIKAHNVIRKKSCTEITVLPLLATPSDLALAMQVYCNQ